MPELKRSRNSLIGLVVLAAIAGAVWAVLASPAELSVDADGHVALTEENANAQFSVVMLFIAIGSVVSAGWGMYCAVRFGSAGPWMIILAGTGAAVAAVVCWLVGLQLGPTDPASLTSLSGGEKLQDKLRVDSPAPFLVWPWSATVTAGLVVLFSRSSRDVGSDGSGDLDQVEGRYSDVQPPPSA